MKRSKGAGSVAQRSIRSRQSAKAIRQDDDASSQNSSHLDSDGSSSHPDSVSNDIFVAISGNLTYSNQSGRAFGGLGRR